MTDEFDIESAIIIAEAETGVCGGNRSIPLCFDSSRKVRSRLWTKEEKDFIRENHERLSDIHMAKELDRTLISVRLHIKRYMHISSRSKSPEIVTAEQIAIGFGCDGKTIHLLIDRGIMPGRMLPTFKKIRVVDRIIFIKWMLNPDHWIYFKPNQVGVMRQRGKRSIGDSYDFVFWENARRLITKAYRKWTDCWLTPRQVKRQLHIEAAGTRYVNIAIKKGNLKATRWGNWWILKSDLPSQGKTINYQGQIVDLKKVEK